MDEARPRSEDGLKWEKHPGCPTIAMVGRPPDRSARSANHCQVGRLGGRSANHLPGRPTRWQGRPTTLLSRFASPHTYKQRNTKPTESSHCIHDVTNPSEGPCNQSRADTWSPDLPQGRPTFLWRQFSHVNYQPPWGSEIKPLEG